MRLKSHSSGLTSAYDTHTHTHSYIHFYIYVCGARDIAVHVCKCTTIVFGTRCRRISVENTCNWGVSAARASTPVKTSTPMPTASARVHSECEN